MWIKKIGDMFKTMFVRQPHMAVDRETLDAAIKYLSENRSVEYNPYPMYNDLIFAALDLLEPDYDYLAHHEKIGNKPIEELNRREIATMLTFIMRGERFCDGHIANYVESGDLLKLLLRLREIEFGEKQI